MQELTNNEIYLMKELLKDKIAITKDNDLAMKLATILLKLN